MPISSTEWDTEDFLTSLRVRINPLKKVGVDLLNAGMRVFNILWPEEPTPTDVGILADRLMDGEARLNEWRESAARVGADEAMTWVLSWYENIDLATLRGVRNGSNWVEDPDLVKQRCHTRGSSNFLTLDMSAHRPQNMPYNCHLATTEAASSDY